MTVPPAFQFYPDDFLGGTVLFNNEQKGLYITLLCIQWNHGQITKEEWRACSGAIATPLGLAVLRKFDKQADGTFKNDKMERVRAQQHEYRAKCSESGKVGAAKRWGGHSDPIHTPMAKHSTPTPTPTPTPVPKVVPDQTDFLDRTGDASRPARAKGGWKKPTREELDLHASKIGLAPDEVEKFVNHYESNGWRVGKNPMRSWPHALVNWKLNRQSYGTNTANHRPHRNDGIIGHEPGRARRILDERNAREAAKAKAAEQRMAT